MLLVLCFSPFQQNIAFAENEVIPSTNNLQDYRQFESFQKRYHDFATELSYFIATSYDSNDHYFRENIQLFRNAINSIYDSTVINNLLDGYENLLSKPIALLGVHKDLRSELWDKIKGYFSNDDVDTTGMSFTSGGENYWNINPPDGYYFRIGNVSYSVMSVYITGQNIFSIRAYRVGSFWIDLVRTENARVFYGESLINRLFGSNIAPDMNSVFSAYYRHNLPIITLIRISDNTIRPVSIPKAPPQIQNVYNRTVNNFNEGERFDKDFELNDSNVIPILVCGEQEPIPLHYIDGVFHILLGDTIIPILLNDGKVTYNGLNCHIDFKFPNIELEPTGNIKIDGESIARIPIGEVPPPPEDLDTSILGYIRKSYEFASQVIATGVDGLRSIIAGTYGLITFSTSLFAFLPPEILALFIGGFSIALGLWVFKR